MDRIVVPLDRSPLSERALPIAQEIARRTGVEVRLLEVAEPEEFDAACSYVDHLADLMTGVDASTDVAFAQPGQPVADAIVRSLDVPGDSLLCMSSHGRSGLGSALLGSTAEDVLRRTHRPVLVVGRECDLPWPGHRRTVLVPIEGTEQDERIFPPVVDIVHRSDLQPVLVQVGRPSDVDAASRGGEALEQARQQLLALGVEAKIEHRFSGNVALTLDEVARIWGAALIVMGLYVASGAPRTLLGSVTMSTVRHAPCPVLTVGPQVSGLARLPELSGGGEVAPVELEIRQIVFATNFAHSAPLLAQAAVSLAGEFRAKLTMVHVIEDYTQLGKDPGPVEESVQHLRELIPADAVLQYNPEILVEFGSGREQILKIASNCDADLLVLGARNAAEVRSTHLPWCTSQHVIAHAHCPVLTLRA